MGKNMRLVLVFVALLLALSFAEPASKVAQQADDGSYSLVFSDEFNLPDGSQPDNSKWSRSRRYWSTWNRWISNSKDVVYIKDGCLVCRAIPNRKEKADTAAMLTGAVETAGKFSFKYGKVECRMRVKRHRGSFPALWLMPQPPAPDHPKGGEIDIFETIDKENVAYQTVHSNWTLNLKKNREPLNAFRVPTSVSKWHVYGLEWDERKLVWTIDGRVVASYAKSEDKKALENGQWPFDAPFYIIINQSVGNGRWADKPDTDYVYETKVDWIRVYKKNS